MVRTLRRDRVDIRAKSPSTISHTRSSLTLQVSCVPARQCRLKIMSSDPSSSSSSGAPSLRDHLVISLSTLPNPYDLHLTVITSKLQRTSSLFPHTIRPPRCYERQYLVTLGAAIPVDSSKPAQPADVPDVLPSHTQSPPHPSNRSNGHESTNPQQGKPENRVVLLSAIHAYLYTMPKEHNSILYISKVDSSGYLPSSSSRLPVTRTLVSSFIGYHLLPNLRPPGDRLLVQLFARSQGQYLFANSSQNPNKKVSGGLALCGWWKAVYEDVARTFSDDGPSDTSDDLAGSMPAASGSRATVKLLYLLPSYTAEEATGMLRPPRIPLPPGLAWSYEPPSPSKSGTESSTFLTSAIPSFPDDPKTRFLDELVSDADARVQSTQPSSSTATSSNSLGPSSSITLVDDQIGHSSGPDAAQEPKHNGAGSKVATTQPTQAQTIRAKERERDEAQRTAAEGALGRVSAREFWERMGFRQECASGDVTGFFSLEVGPSPEGNSNGDAIDSVNAMTPLSSPNDFSNLLVDRLLTALLNCDFATLALAVEGTAIWLKSAKGIIVDELGQIGWEGCTGAVEAKVGIDTSSTGQKRKEEVVTMLQPRKKKK